LDKKFNFLITHTFDPIGRKYFRHFQPSSTGNSLLKNLVRKRMKVNHLLLKGICLTKEAVLEVD